MAPPGLTALGCQGSACDRLRLTGRLRAPPSGVMKYRCAGEVGALMGAIFYAAFGGENRTAGLRPSENHTTALRASEMHPFWWLAPPPSPRRGDFILRYALALFCPACGGSPAQPDRGASAASQSAECLSSPMTLISKSRNADFISIARRAIRNPRGQRPRQT